MTDETEALTGAGGTSPLDAIRARRAFIDKGIPLPWYRRDVTQVFSALHHCIFEYRSVTAGEATAIENMPTDIDTLLAALDAANAELAAAHNDHEYDVEKVLWRLLVANQQYILALAENRDDFAGLWLNRIKAFIRLWMDNPTWYMQHPKWQQDSGDIYDDVTGKPSGAPKPSPDSAAWDGVSAASPEVDN